MDFWIPLLQNLPAKMRLIFVSEYFAKEVMEDTGVELTEEQHSIIHNPIDTNLFNFIDKKPSQRMKVLSIRPYASAKYANDLTVNSILELSKSKEFKEMEFLMVGAGKLFESTLEPLREFDNVKIHEGFLTHSEILELHKQYGIFMTPTRMDSQGVLGMKRCRQDLFLSRTLLRPYLNLWIANGYSSFSVKITKVWLRVF